MTMIICKCCFLVLLMIPSVKTNVCKMKCKIVKLIHYNALYQTELFFKHVNHLKMINNKFSKLLITRNHEFGPYYTVNNMI